MGVDKVKKMKKGMELDTKWYRKSLETRNG